MDRCLAGDLTVEAFTEAYETAWNFEREDLQLTDKESKLYADLFRVAAWYTPIVEDRDRYGGFKDEQDVLVEIRRVIEELESN